MILSAGLIQSLSECRDVALVGGKAANLGRLIRKGFPVPEGFVITTRAYCMSRANGKGVVPLADIPCEIVEGIRAAYAALGGGAVAVRSSATAEDAAAASLAGQYETILDVSGEAQLLEAVQRCWRSFDAPRARAYLHERRIDPSGVNMAVVVQRLVAADVAGVLFTSNPHNGWRHEMLIEASWGLGETVVSGQVQPDALRLDAETGKVLEATVADKRVRLLAGSGEEQPVEESRRRLPCLTGRDVHALWQLGVQVAERLRAPQDIEWAIHDDQVYLLQARPITALADAENHEKILSAARRQLHSAAAAGRGPWVVHNLAETLPHPTPLSWSVVKRFMSGAGGFGAMYRMAGFQPSPLVCREGFLDLVAGYIYMDASRAPEMFFEDFPFAYDLNELLRSPDASQSPPTLPRGPLRARMRVSRQLAAANATLHALSDDCDRRMLDRVFPAVEQYVADEKRRDLTGLSAAELVECWREREAQVLDEFSPQLLLPSLIAAMAIADLQTFLAENFWNEDPQALAYLLSSGGPPDRTVVADGELYETTRGNRSLEEWLTAHGHRAVNEFDLAAPRWREQPKAAGEMAAHLAAGESPLERYRRHQETVNRRADELRKGLAARDRREFDRLVNLVRRYVGFREHGKDSLMFGYDLLRDVALEAGRRLEIGDDVFYLTREELFDALSVGFAPFHLIERHKLAHKAGKRLHLPHVIDEQSIDALGNSPVTANETAPGVRQGLAISAGEAAGPARIVASPAGAGELGQGYILVCPATDPSWTPLFAGAAGLVLERGGMLSHGAVVAREMGLPAVVLLGACQLFDDGQEIRVDGNRGWVGPKSGDNNEAAGTEAEDQPVARELIPPPPGRKDRRAARVRDICAVLWTAFLLAVFLLPERWAYQPTLWALDWVLWPAVRACGRPAAVAILAAGMAALTLVVQTLLTDNRRLREAKRREAALNKMAAALPPESPRRTMLQRLAGGVTLRGLSAALVPVGILLGPMVMPFVWLKQRIDPAVWNAPPGSAVSVVATVDSDCSEAIRIDAPQAVVVDDATPRVQTLPPIRKTLQHLLALYRRPQNDPSLPWELKAAPDLARQQTADNLQAYLDAGVLPQGITWTLRPPESLQGRFLVTISTEVGSTLTAQAVLGDDFPPGPAVVKGVAGSPIRELRLVYPRPKVEPVFCRPLAFVAGVNWVPLGERLAVLNVGWLTLYIVVYIAALMLVRVLLRVA